MWAEAGCVGWLAGLVDGVEVERLLDGLVADLSFHRVEHVFAISAVDERDHGVPEFPGADLLEHSRERHQCIVETQLDFHPNSSLWQLIHRRFCGLAIIAKRESCQDRHGRDIIYLLLN